MSWEFFTAPKQPGEMITAEDVRELFEAFDERLKCAHGEQSEVHFTNPGVVTKVIQWTEDSAATPNERTESFTEALIRLSRLRYAWADGDGYFRQFGWSGSKPQFSVIRLAGEELGYTTSFLENFISVNSSVSGTATHVADADFFNICRKALQIMDIVRIRMELPGTPAPHNKNILKLVANSRGKLVSASEEIDDWDDAKAEFVEKDWTSDTPSPIGPVVAAIRATRNSSCRYDIRAARSHRTLVFTDEWGELGYELLTHRSIGASTGFNYAPVEWTLGLNEETPISRSTPDPGAGNATQYTDTVLGPNATEIDLELLEQFTEMVDYEALDSLPRPQNSAGGAPCDAETVSWSTELSFDDQFAGTEDPALSRVLLHGKPNFNYGPDPE